MSRLYISGPITGTLNYKKIFQGAKDALLAKGYDVVNPAELTEVIGGSFTYDEIMSIDLDLLNRCDALVQLPGWERSRGANIEYGYAMGAGKPILSFDTLMEGSVRG